MHQALAISMATCKVADGRCRRADLVIEDPFAPPVAAVAVGQALGRSHQARHILAGPQVQVSAAALRHWHLQRGPGKGFLKGAPPGRPGPQASQQA